MHRIWHSLSGSCAWSEDLAPLSVERREEWKDGWLAGEECSSRNLIINSGECDVTLLINISLVP